MSEAILRKPPWLKVKLPTGENFFRLKGLVNELKLNTVCEDSLCPNIAECWGKGTCTFMILGEYCTRACGFCAVKPGAPKEYDIFEPMRVANAVKKMGVKYAVITSVARDDLEDGGSYVFAETIRSIRRLSPETRVEVLIPDMMGRTESLSKVWEARPDVLAHNVECVPRLQRYVRSKATWERSVFVLDESKKAGMKTKSGIQLGHGETWEELMEAFDRLAAVGLDILTIGQYLQPTKRHLVVQKYYEPLEFGQLRMEAMKRGIRYVFSGPLVRSSYKAHEVFEGS